MGDVHEIEQLVGKVVVVSTKVDLPQHTINTLTSTIEQEWRKKDPGRPLRLQYTRGGPLVVERMVRLSPEAEDQGLLTPYLVAKNNSEFDMLSRTDKSPLETLCMASEALHRKGTPARYLVCQDRRDFDKWVGVDLDVGRVFNVDVFEDPDVPKQVRCLLCGSASGAMIDDVEATIIVTKEQL